MTIEEDRVMVTNPLGKRESNIPMTVNWEKKKSGDEEGDKEDWIWILMLPVIHVAVTEMWCVGMKASDWKGK